MNLKVFTAIILGCLLSSCNGKYQTEINNTDIPKMKNKGHELIYNMVQKVGDYDELSGKKNVEYTYTYQTPDNKTDISIEKYIFDGELSYGKYTQHERTLPQLKGIIEQGFDGNEYWLKHNGKIVSDSSHLERVTFNRKTNFYWFAMMQKLLDPGLNYEYLGEETKENQDYDIVKVTFNTDNGKPTDIYQLYINRRSLLVDQFLFTVADFGKMETPNLMILEYENIEGILIPTKRKYKKSTWKANISDEPWIKVTWSDIKFDTGIAREYFQKNK